MRIAAASGWPIQIGTVPVPFGCLEEHDGLLAYEAFERHPVDRHLNHLSSSAARSSRLDRDPLLPLCSGDRIIRT